MGFPGRSQKIVALKTCTKSFSCSFFFPSVKDRDIYKELNPPLEISIFDH